MAVPALQTSVGLSEAVQVRILTAAVAIMEFIPFYLSSRSSLSYEALLIRYSLPTLLKGQRDWLRLFDLIERWCYGFVISELLPPRMSYYGFLG